MSNTATVLAFDFGASSGSAIRAVYDGQNLTYEEIHRFEMSHRKGRSPLLGCGNTAERNSHGHSKGGYI